MATKDGRAQIWYADANGVVTGNTPSADNVASAIIDSYNEHFGTDIQIWTAETITLRVGDTIPNWNTYEKIEMPIYLALKNGEITYFCGKLQNNVFELYGPEDDKMFAVQDTIIHGATYGANSYLSQYVIPKLTSLGYEIYFYNIESNGYKVGDEIADWDNYVKIT